METIIGALFPITFILMLVLERVFPARALPKVPYWLLKGIVFFVLSAVTGGLVPGLIANVAAVHAPLHFEVLGPVLGGIFGFFLIDIVSYAVHRLLHNVPLLWRCLHQLHHSAERLDVAGSGFFHPFDVFIQGGATVLAAGVLGLSPSAAALAAYLSFFVGTFSHMNVRTPQWLGWIIQRPEAHSVHHARGVHAYNYGNFMLWDIVFGTFRNPTTFMDQAGFWDGASSKVGSMLIGRDVGEPRNPMVNRNEGPSMAAV